VLFSFRKKVQHQPQQALHNEICVITEKMNGVKNFLQHKSPVNLVSVV